MQIVIFSHYYTPEIGAPSARLSESAKSWAAHGAGVQVVTCFPNHPTGIVPEAYRGRLTRREWIEGVEVLRSWTYATPNRGTIRKTLGHISYLVSALVLSAPGLRRADVAIGSSPTLFAALAACLFSLARRIPFVFEVRDLWPAIFVELGVLRPGLLLRILESMELWLYRRAACIITVTDSFRESISARGIDPAKIVTIPNGADCTFFNPAPPDPAFREQIAPGVRFVALYIGAHGLSQGLTAILRAAELLKAHPDIGFVFVGEGAEKDQLVAEAKRLSLSNVRFLPGQPHECVPGFYHLADVCFVPLRAIPLFKTFIPSKMFEIMAAGRPIIGSVEGEARTILERSGAALLVPPEDGAGIAAAVQRLADDSTLAAQMGHNGRVFVEREYQREALADRYLTILNGLIRKAH